MGEDMGYRDPILAESFPLVLWSNLGGAGVSLRAAVHIVHLTNPAKWENIG